MTRVPATTLAGVEALLLQNDQLTAEELAARLGEPMPAVRHALRSLVCSNLAHGVALPGKAQAFRWGPESRETVATSAFATSRTPYVPPRWTNEIARPEGENHKLCGSLQFDGTVKPYSGPRFGCVGTLADRTSNARG